MHVHTTNFQLLTCCVCVSTSTSPIYMLNQVIKHRLRDNKVFRLYLNDEQDNQGINLHQNKNREEVKNREIRYLPDLSIFNLLSIYVLVQRILNHYPNYPTHRLYLWEVETPYIFRMNNLSTTIVTHGIDPVADRQSVPKLRNTFQIKFVLQNYTLNTI